MSSDDPIEPIHAVPPSPPERVVGPRWNMFQGMARYLRYRMILQRRKKRKDQSGDPAPNQPENPPGFDRKA